MTICFECGILHGFLLQTNGMIGWIDKCDKCSRVTKVYPSKNFGVNPIQRDPVTKEILTL